MTIRLPAVCVILALPVLLPAQKPFEWSATLGMDYYESSRVAADWATAQDESVLLGRVDLRFASALFSPRILRYALSFSVEEGDRSFIGTEDTLSDTGYGIDLELWPESSHRIRAFVHRNSVDIAPAFGPDYNYRTDSYGFDAWLGGYRVSFKHLDKTTTGLAADDRIDEEGLFNRAWKIGKTRFSADLRHYRREMAYYDMTSLYQEVTLFSSTALKMQGTLNARLSARRVEVENGNVGLSTARNTGVADIQWRQVVSTKWESLQDVETLYSDEEEGYHLRVIERYQVAGPLRLDATLGYFSRTAGEFLSEYPYYGLGWYYAKSFYPWRVTSEGGYRVFDRNRSVGNRYEEEPYGSIGIYRSGTSASVGLEINYDGIRGEILDPDIDLADAGRETYVLVTRDHILGRFEYRQAIYRPITLIFTTIYKRFDEEVAEGTARSTSLSNGIALTLRNGKVAARYTDYEQEADPFLNRVDTWDFQLQYRLNTHMALHGLYILRDRVFQGLAEDEEDLDLSLDYVIGKFSLRGTYLLRSVTSEVENKEYSLYRVTLSRKFGNV